MDAPTKRLEPEEAEAQDLDKRARDKLDRMAAAMDRVERLLRRLGLQGLQRMTASSRTELLALEQTAHNAGLVKIEREIDRLSTYVQRYLDRDPLFRMDEYVASVNRIWLLNRRARVVVAAGGHPKEMTDELGEARRSYELDPEPMLLQPLGAYGWVSDTDFVGITVLFYRDGDDARLFQASAARPTAYFGTDPRRLMSGAISDYVQYSIHDMAHGAFEFRNAKVSRDGRLSLHKDLVVQAAPYIGARAYKALTSRDWVELLERLRGGNLHPVSARTEVYAFVEPARVGAVHLDDKNAVARLPLYDHRGGVMHGHVPLRAENNFLVDNLIALFGKDARRPGKLRPDALFGRAWVEGGQLRFFPYTAVFQQPIVLGSRDNRKRVNELHLSLEAVKDAVAPEEP